MRQLCLSFAALVAVATPAAAQDMRRLTPAEVAKGFEGRAACRTQGADGACSTVIVEVSTDGNRRVVQEISVAEITEIVDSASASFVRAMPMYARYEGLFSALARQRSAGDYRFLKIVETAEGVYRAGDQAWCSRGREADAFERVEFFFSNSLGASVLADEPVAPELQLQLQSFLTELYADPAFRSRGGHRPTSDAIRDVMLGRREVCIGYVGSVVSGTVTVRGIVAESEGMPLPPMNDLLVMLPAGSDIRLSPN